MIILKRFIILVSQTRYVEHRGTVVDDMIIGEVTDDLKRKLVVHQEVYNTPEKVLLDTILRLGQSFYAVV